MLRRTGAWKDALRRRMLAAADILAAVAAIFMMQALEKSVAGPTTLLAFATVPLWLVVAKARGLYDHDHVQISHETADELTEIVLWSTLCVAATALIVSGISDASLAPGAALEAWGVAIVADVLLRAGARLLWRRVVPPERGLVIGEGPVAEAFVRKLTLESGHHLDLSMRVVLDRADREEGRVPSVTADGLTELIADAGAERVILAHDHLDEDTVSRLASACRALGVKLSVAPPMRAMLGTAVELNHLAELPLVEFHTWQPSRSTMASKRLFDLAGAALMALLALPLAVLIAVAIKVDTRGPVFYRQRRTGRNGRPFRMLKFRTMVDGADSMLAEVVDVSRLEDPMFKLQRDPRVTRVGRALRRTSLDELPQLLNVIAGHMSLVGPRPEEVWLTDRYEEPERFRLQMRPGMTGPMQVHGRGELRFAERMALEREYVENFTLARDLKILARTLTAVLRGRGAY